MKIHSFLYRIRWSILIVVCALGAWWLAFQYLIEFRPPDVPFVTTPHDVVEAMLDLTEVTHEDMVYDLGSGDGRILLAAAKRGAKAVGYEIDPDLVAQSQRAVAEAQLADRIKVYRGDIFKQDLRAASVITMFLKPYLNAQLRPQLEQLKPGTRIVSHMFSMPGVKPTKKIAVLSKEDGLEHNVYLWITPLEWDGKGPFERRKED
jgi:SAM-dependent methyltransferase